MLENIEEYPVLNNDGVLENTFSILANRSAGIGTSRDKSQHLSVNPPQILTEDDRISLFRSSNICRKLVTIYPVEAAKAWFEPTSDDDKLDSEKLLEFFDNLPTGSLREKFVEASCESRLHGDAYLLLGIDDGNSWDMPLEENKIKSFRWVEILYHDEVTPDFTYGIRPIYYWISSSLGNQLPDNVPGFLKVHKSRLLRFPGYKLYGRSLYNNAGKNESVLQSMFASFAAYYQALMCSSAMIVDYNIFKYKLKGLSKLVLEGKQDALLQRFITMQMGMSITKGLAVDAESEDADFITRSYGGVKDIISALQDQLVASCDVPRFKLLGDSGSNTGLDSGMKSEQQRFEWAASVKSWTIDNWQNHLKYLCKLAFLAKNTGFGSKIPPKFGIKINSIFEQSPLEEQEMRLKKAQEHKLNIENGLYLPFEARMSTYGKNIWNAEVTLNDEISAKMEKQAIEDFDRNSEMLATSNAYENPESGTEKKAEKSPEGNSPQSSEKPVRKTAQKKSEKSLEKPEESSRDDVNSKLDIRVNTEYNKGDALKEDSEPLKIKGKSLTQKELDTIASISAEDVLVTLEKIVSDS